MKALLGLYAGRFNRRHTLVDHLFRGRCKSLLIEGSGNGHLQTVCAYVHPSPMRAKRLKSEQPLGAFSRIIWPAFLAPPSKRPAWLRVGRSLGAHDILNESLAGRRELATRLEARRVAEKTGEYKPVRRGWRLTGTHSGKNCSPG